MYNKKEMNVKNNENKRIIPKGGQEALDIKVTADTWDLLVEFF